MFQEAQARTSQAIAEALVFDKKEKQAVKKGSENQYAHKLQAELNINYGGLR